MVSIGPKDLLFAVPRAQPALEKRGALLASRSVLRDGARLAAACLDVPCGAA